MTDFNWKINKFESSSRARTGILTTPHGKINTPAFVFCATKAALKTLSTDEVEKLEKNKVKIVFTIYKWKKAKISKIYFLCDKKLRDKRLRDVITSEEARFWKVLSRNIYLNPDRIELDKRLLKNYFLGLGYYNAEVLSSSVELKNESNVELTFSINAGQDSELKNYPLTLVLFLIKQYSKI